MEEEKEFADKEYECYIESRWSRFHQDNKGYNFMNKVTGRILDKSQIYNLFMHNEDELSRLSTDRSEIYERVDKTGYERGKYVGIRKYGRRSTIVSA